MASNKRDAREVLPVTQEISPVPITDPNYIEGLSAAIDKVLPIWSRQIEYARSYTEEEIVSLTNHFAELSQKLSVAISASEAAAGSVVSGDSKGLLKEITASQEALGGVVTMLRNVMQEKQEMMEHVLQLASYIKELKDMSEEVSKIARQTNLLALNASIEAARAGHQGRGFAVVASAVRELSLESGQTGKLIGEKVELISQEMKETIKVAEQTAKRDNEATNHSEEVIHGVMTRFREITDGLSQSAKIMQTESHGIAGEIQEILVSFQFQDRVSQILDAAVENINFFHSHVDEILSQDEHEPGNKKLNTKYILSQMHDTYTTEEQRSSHSRGGANLDPKASEITFF